MNFLGTFGGLASGLTLLLALAGCSKTEGENAAATGLAPSASSAAAAPAVPEWVGEETWADLSALPAECKLTAKSTPPLNCAALQKVKSELQASPAKQAAWLPAVAFALGHPTAELQVIAADLLSGAYRDVKSLGKAQLEPKTVELLINSFANAKDEVATLSAGAVALLGTLAEQDTLLVGVIERHAFGKAREAAYRNLLHFGGPASLKKLQEVALGAAEGDALAAANGLVAIDDFRLRTLGAELCPWVEKLALRPEPVFQQRAVTLWMRCQGEYVDQAVNLVKSNASGSHAGEFFAAMGDRCTPSSSHARCDEVKTMLLAAWNDKKLDDSAHLEALRSLSAQWRDAKVDAALKQGAKSELPQIRILAENELQERAQFKAHHEGKTQPASTTKKAGTP